MKQIFSTILALAAIASPAAQATTPIDFESDDCVKAVSVYDVWEQSPFRTGILTGNAAITANPDATGISSATGEVGNASATVAGAQRSRFGSNRFGLRIDLNETFELTPTRKYVHVRILKPKAGRVMLVGLGSRTERTGQNPYCEQFWEVSTNEVAVGEWNDAVFEVKGAGGIDIRSLVIVPDCESPHKLTEDFLFYVDDIEINDNSRPRGVVEYYLINGDKNTSKLSRDDRYTSAANLNGSADGNQSISTNQKNDKKLYQNCLDKQLTARPGETLTPSLDFNGSWMHGFFYIDLNQNGAFDDNELMACSSNLKDNVVANNRIPMQSFTLPASTAPGLYRCRFKTDWASKDPAGNNDTGNLIASNGGVIIDAMLNVHGTEVSVNDFQLNGEVLAADGTKLDALKVPFGQPFAIKMNPEKGFFHNGAVIRSGYNLDAEKSTDKFGNPQYTVTTVPGSQFTDDVYTIPGELMRGNVLINGVMLEDGSVVEPDDVYAINFPEDLKITRTDRKLNALTLTPSAGGASTVINCADNTANKVYINKLDHEVTVGAGATVTPSVNYTGNAMHTYFYVDLDEDGQFSNELNADGTPAGELLSYSHYEGKNSTGATQAPGITPATSFPFVIPAETPAGVYRCRFKIDWNNIDPAGQYSTAAGATNQIDDNGGYLVDFMLHVKPSKILLSAATTDHGSLCLNNGTEITEDGIELDSDNEILLAATTSTGSRILSVVARHGYHHELAANFMGNNYWSEAKYEVNAESSTISIPANKADRHVAISSVEIDPSDSLTDISADNADVVIYDLMGRRVMNPTTGIYIVNGHKQAIR